MGFEFKKHTPSKESARAEVAPPPRYDRPEDVVDPYSRAREEADVWEAHGIKLDASARAQELGIAIAERQIEVQKLERQIAETEARLTKLKAKLIDRILSRKLILALEDETQGAEESMKRNYATLLRYAEFAEGFEQLVEEEKLHEALAKEEQRVAAEEAVARDVYTQALRHNCFFVHAIVEEVWKPADNNHIIDTKKASFNDQVAIINGIGPTLSTSTVGFGTRHRTFNTTTAGPGAGVFISRGRILAASPGDMGSRAVGLYERTTGGGNTNKEAIEEAIGQRMHGNVDQYNELTVAQPEISGIYFRLNGLIDDQEWQRLNESTPKQPHEPPDEYKLPMHMKDRVVKGRRIQAGLSKDSWKKLKEARTHGVPLYTLTEDNKAYVITTIDEEREIIGIEAGARTPADVMETFFNQVRENINPKETREEKAKRLIAQLGRGI